MASITINVDKEVAADLEKARAGETKQRTKDEYYSYVFATGVGRRLALLKQSPDKPKKAEKKAAASKPAVKKAAGKEGAKKAASKPAAKAAASKPAAKAASKPSKPAASKPTSKPVTPTTDDLDM